MKYSNPTIQRAAELVGLLSAVLFFGFCFLYIYHFQDGLLSFAQHYYSAGRTAYSPFTSALLASTLLTTLGLVLSAFLPLPLYARAVAYMPSCLLLGLLTDVNILAVFPYHQGAHWWAFVLYFLLFFVLAFLGYAWRDSVNLGGSKLPFVVTNLGILTLLLFLATSLSNTDEYQHRLLSLEQSVIEGDDDHVLDAFNRSHAGGPAMRPLEAYVLARNGLLPDSLFATERFTSSSQLLPAYADTLRAVALPRRLATLFGVALDSTSQLRTLSYLRACTRDSLCRPAVVDYLLTACLLDRQVRHFAESYALQSVVSSSHIYREALALAGQSTPATADSLAEYLAARAAAPDTLADVRQKYAHTYWAYYYR